MIMKYVVCIVTSTRADWGLLRPLAVRINNDDLLKLRIVATGMHLSAEFGYTYREIEQDGFQIDESIPILLHSGTAVSTNKSMGLALISFGEYFDRKPPDLLILLGDRSEIFAVSAAAVNARIPIAHLHGGEITVGAVDECFRHSITKMSCLHFTCCEEYRRRVIQLGENPDNVFNVGALGIENIKTVNFMSREALAESVDPALLSNPYGVVTFHPVTLEKNTAVEQCKELLSSLAGFPELTWVCTMANSDTGGEKINQLISRFTDKYPNMIFVKSLGNLRYLSALKYAEMVVGNSSSGILEAPSFHIPTVNIGDRQKGRVRAATVIDCEPTVSSITSAIKKARDDDFRSTCLNVENPFGDGNTSSKILQILKDQLTHNRINLKKEFYMLGL